MDENELLAVEGVSQWASPPLAYTLAFLSVLTDSHFSVRRVQPLGMHYLAFYFL